MSGTDAGVDMRPTGDAKRAAAAGHATADQATENPQREWIDTLLTAAAMTRSKKRIAEGGADTTTNADDKGKRTGAGYKASDRTVDVAVQTMDMDEEGDPNQGTDDNDADDSTQQDDGKRYRRRRCEVDGCTKFARFNNACSGHGGRRLCSQPGCKRVAQFGHKCSAHGGVKYCSVEGCSRAVQSRGFCKTHGGGVRCKFEGCVKGAISKGHCRAHGGGSRCAEDGCQKWAQRHGFCVRHAKAANPPAEQPADTKSAQV